MAEGPHLCEAAEAFYNIAALRMRIRFQTLFLVDFLQTVSCAVHQSDPQNLSHHMERAEHHFCVMVGWVEPVGAEIMMSFCSE